ncbi:hypothetical protein N7517_009923 [Penicillium concentricum]|uniref:Uncharacterized protein n=1 Tax=Penicillium concentricum TaxID=293559 RepID=A0A9W9UX82_9EURO|nr:uncharacterized protein N7517_009923 [Penicillium concentricum]KAJ5360732.1 hypothetical protein N7517_009923 [Penicillium concentricum]
MGKDSWLWEITSLVFSAACVVAIVAVLINKQETTLAAWNLPIALNTVISVLATVSKACLLLPVAASISQLKWLHFNRPHRLSDLDLYNNASCGPLGALLFVCKLPLSLGALGAVITLVALAFDPFAQQLVSFPSRQAAMHNETASFRISQAYETGAYYNPQNNIVDYTDFAMQGAIYNGVFGSPSPRAFICPTSQCTWPDNSSYISLGAAGACKNVTQSVVNTCEYPMNSRLGDCNITTPGGYHLTSKRRHQSATFQYTLLNTTIGPSKPYADLINFAVWRLIGQNLSEFEVHECRLSLTAYLYRNVSVTRNTLHIQDEIPVPLKSVGSPNSGLNWFRPSVGQFPPEVMFALHAADHAKITDLLADIFDAQAMTPFGEGAALTDVLVAGNLSRIVENIGWGITERIRTGRNSTIANGLAYRLETYIHVNWPWITLPVLVVIGAGILLACSIMSNFRRSATLWKSSNLALLFHSVEGVRDYGHMPLSSNDVPLAGIEALGDKLCVLRGDNMEFTPRP